MFQEVKDKYNLTCTENEFNTYMKEYCDSHTLPILLEKYTFNDLYNGNKIESPFVDDNAIYYTLQICGNTYLQTYKPYISWIEMITDDNFNEVSSDHANKLVDQYLQYESLQNAIEYFQSNQKK